MKAYGVKDQSDCDNWLRAGKSSKYSPPSYGSIRAGKKNVAVKNQLRRNMKRAERQHIKHDIRMELA